MKLRVHSDIIDAYIRDRDRKVWEEWANQKGADGDPTLSAIFIRLVNEEVENRTPSKFKMVGED